MKAEKFIAFFGNNWKAILITILVLIAIWYILKWTGIADEIKAKFKRASKATDQNGGDGSDAMIVGPDGNLIPYDPRPDTIRLRNAMEGAGTDEDAIFDVLEDKTNPQLTAIYNDFQKLTSENLFDWFDSELSGDDLQKAMDYFESSGINFT